MDWTEIIEVGGAITVSLGGAGAVIIALSSYIGKIWAEKILASDRRRYQEEIEGFKHKLSIRKSAYERYLDLIIDYHDQIYRHYRLCQKTESADLITYPEREDLDTKEDFLGKIDEYAGSLNEIEGKLRIILPQEILDIHNKLVGEFNEFKDIVKTYSRGSESKSPEQLRDSFIKIDESQKELEKSLRELLRTENILK